MEVYFHLHNQAGKGRYSCRKGSPQQKNRSGDQAWETWDKQANQTSRDNKTETWRTVHAAVSRKFAELFCTCDSCCRGSCCCQQEPTSHQDCCGPSLTLHMLENCRRWKWLLGVSGGDHRGQGLSVLLLRSEPPLGCTSHVELVLGLPVSSD